jgi:hypothetical protein
MQTDTKAFLRAAFGSTVAGFGYVSTLATFIPAIATFRAYLWTLSGVLIVVGVFRGGLKIIATKNGELERLKISDREELNKLKISYEEELKKLRIAREAELTNIRIAHDREKESTRAGHEKEEEAIRSTHEAEVQSLKQLIEKLQRDPFEEDIKARVKMWLRDLIEKERSILKNLLQYGSWDPNRVMPGLTSTVQEQSEVFRKGFGAGILDTEEVLLGGHRRIHYKARPQYEAALKKYLYEAPEGLEKPGDPRDPQSAQ